MRLRASSSYPHRAATRRLASRSDYQLSNLEPRYLLSSGMVATPALSVSQLPPPAIGGEVFYDNFPNGNIAGRTSNGDGIPNILVELLALPASGGTSTTPTLVATALTDVNGNYGFSGLQTNTTYEEVFVAPAGYFISPLGNSPNPLANSVAVGDNEVTPIIGTYDVPAVQTNSTITANCGMYSTTVPLPSISGTVFNDLNANGIADDGATLPNVTVELLNATNQTVVATTTTDANGDYSFTSELTVGNSYMVKFITPSGYQFSPEYQAIDPAGFSMADPTTGIADKPTNSYVYLNFPFNNTNYTSQTFNVFSDTGQVNINCGMYAEIIKITGPSVPVPRSHTVNTDAVFTVTITPSNNLTISVPYSTADGPADPANDIGAAIAGTDYVAESGTLVFTPGVSVLTFSVPIIANNTPELNVQFHATISPPGADFPTSQNVLSANCIIENTNFPSVAINNVEAARPTTGTTDFDFTVTLSTTAPYPVSISYQTVDSSALAGVNYTQTTGTLVIPANTLTGTVSVPVLAGTGPTQSKAFLVVVQDVTNLTYEDTPASAIAEGVGTIDSNAAPELSVTGGTVTESLIGNFLLPFTITINPAPLTPVTIDYATSDGTAVAGVDYAPTSGSVTFAIGQTSATLNVLAYRRFVAAQNVTVNMTVTDPSNTYSIIAPTGVGTIQDIGTIALPLNAKHKVTYTDYLKNPVSVAMKGPGSGQVVFLGTTSVATNAYEIVLTGTTAASSLTIGTAHNLQTSFVNILADSSVGAIVGKTSNLIGLLTTAGSLNQLTLDYVQGADITVGPGTGSLAINFGRAVDTDITSAIPIKSLTAVSYVSSTAQLSTITAPSVGPIRVKQGFQGTVVQAETIASVTVGGSMDGSELLASNAIGTVAAASITGSTIFAGVDPSSSAASTGTGLPTASDFSNTGSKITSVKVSKPGSFADTRIASWKIGTLNLGAIDSSDDGVSFGVTANSIASVLGNSGTPIKLLGVTAASTPLVDDDFSIQAI